MRMRSRRLSQGRDQDGYALLVIMLALSVFVISLAQVVPNWATEARREREARTIDYARQYRTAIKRYFHKNGRYPASIEVLVQHDASGLRYLRQSWADPLVSAAAAGASGTGANGQEDFDGWQVIHFGQAVDAEIVDQPPPSMRAATGGIAGPNLTGAASTMPNSAGVGASSAAPTQPGISSAPGSATNQPGSTLGSTPTGGGGAVIGVAPLSKKPALHAFNGFDIPNDWQFVYNYAQDPSLRTGATPTNSLLPGGTPAPGASPGMPSPNNVAPPASPR